MDMEPVKREDGAIECQRECRHCRRRVALVAVQVHADSGNWAGFFAQGREGPKQPYVSHCPLCKCAWEAVTWERFLEEIGERFSP